MTWAVTWAVTGLLSGAVMLRVNPAPRAGTVEVDAGSLLSVSGPVAAKVAPVPTTSVISTAPAFTAPASPGPSTASPTSATVPTPDGEKPSSSSDRLEPWDPFACPANQRANS